MVTDSSASLQPPDFVSTLRQRAAAVGSWLCLGLDPDPALLPPSVAPTPAGVVDFCRSIIEATSDWVAAYKINFAFFEALGPAGWSALAEVRAAVSAGVPVIADAKRADIPNTATFYADAIFGSLGFDAVTANPYLGWDSLQPFFDFPGRGVFVLARTSNPGGADLQELEVEGEPLYLHVARGALRRRGADTCLVVGATDPSALRRVRELDPNAVLLVVGVGAQGGRLEEALAAGANEHGANALIGMSRHILYAGSGAGYARAAGDAARQTANVFRPRS
jgi:orotidine-5'-phosphate decarboxylase